MGARLGFPPFTFDREERVLRRDGTTVPLAPKVAEALDVLLAVPGATPEIVDTYIAQRRDALAAKLPPPVFPVAGIGAATLNLWRIRAEVTTADGVTFAREAVVRPGGEGRRLTILEWQEGDRRLLAASDKDSSDKANGTHTQ